MLIFDYPTKKAMREAVGQRLRFRETSMFGAEYRRDGVLVGCNRPHETGPKREFFAEVVLEDGKIAKVR